MAGNTTYLFLDESGDHSLDKIDSQYPVFVLGGALISKRAYPAIEERLNSLKKELFGTEKIVLHTADIIRNKNGFERMKEASFREKALADINRFMAQAPYQALGCAILKDKHAHRYSLAALDPYLLSFKILVERAFFAVGKTGKLHIVAEKRNPYLDNKLELAFLDLKVSGTEFIQPSEINRLGIELHLRDKRKNITGLQMADLLVSPMGRFVIGKKPREDWKVIEPKLYRYKGKWEGAGLVVLPKKSLKEEG